ncbi:hypothetical protein [Azospirillum sp. TSO22-1]|nr:hypothetical protein [Azospirillum sp. TSO22-1]
MAARQASVIDLAAYRRRREEHPPQAAPAVIPMVWIPVWVMMPVWRAF